MNQNQKSKVILWVVLLASILVLSPSKEVRAEKLYRTTKGKFSISFPGDFTEKVKPRKTSAIYQVTSMNNGQVYSTRFGVNDSVMPEKARAPFLQNMVKTYLGKGTIEAQKDVTVDGTKAKWVKFKTLKDGQVVFTEAKFIVKENTWYALLAYAVGRYVPAESSRVFMDSFKWAK